MEASSNCSRDSLVIIDTITGDQLHTLCGNNTPSDVTSSGNQLLVVFRTNDVVHWNGFLVTYTARTVNNGTHRVYRQSSSFLVILIMR